MAVRLLWLCGCAFVLGGASSSAAPARVAKKIRSRAFRYLQLHQNQDGSYGRREQGRPIVGTTALVVYTFAIGERAYREKDGPFMSRAVKFIVKHQNQDGSFGRGAFQEFATYAAISALQAVKNPAYAASIKRGLKYAKEHLRPQLKNKLTPGVLWPYGILAATGHFRVLVMTKGVIETGFLADPLKAAPPIKLAATTRWLASTIAALAKRQFLADDTSLEYGRFVGSEKNPLESDPVVATALAARTADLIKMNYNKVLARDQKRRQEAGAAGGKQD